MHALALIQQCLDSRSIYLDLGNCGLTDALVATGSDIDKALRQCTHVETLILSNRWYDWKKEEWQDSQNTSKENFFTTHPPALLSLCGLHKLICAGDDDKKWEIPSMDFVAAMMELQSLDISYNQIVKLAGLDKLSALQSFSISSNQITKLEGLDKLNALQSFSISSNQITKLEGLDKLSALQSFYISYNQITKLEGLDKLSALQSFYIYNNKITKLEGLDKLSALQYFSISDNQITKLEGLDKLSALQYFSISDNQITKLEGLDKLSALQSFYIYNNKITKLEGLDKLSALQYFYIYNNKITKLQGLYKLIALQDFSIFNNQITKLEGLDKLSALQSFYIYNNKITKLEGLDKLIALQSFQISYNKIEDIRPLLPLLQREKNPLQAKWTYSANHGEITLMGNPLVSPPQEVVEQGNAAIIAYFASLQQAEKIEYLYEAKLVVVGRGAAGKTTLVKKLTDKNFHLNPIEPTTTGIAILGKPWELQMTGLEDKEAFTFHIWDFGGQEKYDATHQFFITKRSIYLFLTEARNEDNYLDYDKWLRTIALLSKKSPVIVVQTKTDVRDKAMPETQYKTQFPNIVAFVKVSAKDGKEHTLETLKDYIREAAKLLPQNQEKLSNRWVDVREELQALAETRDYISYSEYLAICSKCKIDAQQADFLSDFLHDLGIIIHHQRDSLLKKTVIINPDWGVDGVYKVIDDRQTIQNNGHFNEDDIQRIWDEDKYNEKQPELLALMRKYELCFEVKPQQYIAPELLCLDAPAEFAQVWQKATQVLPYRYEYDFMPAGIMGRLIVKAHDNLHHNLFWKTGAVFSYQNAKAWVEEKYYDKRLHISLQGDSNDSKALLAILRNHLAAIHAHFENLVFQEKLPCPCEKCKGMEEPYFHILSVIKEVEKNPAAGGKLQCQKNFSLVDIRHIKAAVFPGEGGSLSETIKELLQKDQLKEVLTFLYNDTLIEDRSLVTGLMARLKHLKDNESIGIIDAKECTLERNKIRNDIIGFVSQL